MKKTMIMIIIAVIGTLSCSTECGKAEENFVLANRALTPYAISMKIERENALGDCIHELQDKSLKHPTWIENYLSDRFYYYMKCIEYGYFTKSV